MANGQYSTASWGFLAFKAAYTFMTAWFLVCCSVVFAVLKAAGVWKMEREKVAAKLNDRIEEEVEKVNGRASFHELPTGETMFVVEAGPKNGFPVMLFHGFPDCWSTWTPIIPRLTAMGYRVICPDQLGQGLSGAPAASKGLSGWHYKSVVADFHALAQILGLKKYGVCGHDWGAPHAWGYAAHYPDEVAALAVISTPPNKAFLNLFKTFTIEQLLSSWYFLFFQLPVLPDALMSLWPDWTAWMVGAWTGQTLSTAHQHVIASLLATDGAATSMLNNYRALRSKVPRDIVPKPVKELPMPVVYITGDADEYLPPCVVPAAKEVVPTMQHVSLHTGHWVQSGDVEGVTNAMDALWSKFK